MSEPNDRLRELLGVPAAARVLERLRARLARGADLTGFTILADATDDEKQHFASILGTSKTHGTPLRIELEKLDALLRHASIAADLREAVEQLIGAVSNRRNERDAIDAAWRDVYARLDLLAQHDSRLVSWAETLRLRGLLKRLARGSTEQASMWIDDFQKAWSCLPVNGIPLARFAADTFGDAHALDIGKTLSALLLRAIPTLAESLPADELSPAERRRELWAAAGVLSDELSGAVLTLNLPAEPTNATGSLLCTARAAGEPIFITLRQLLRTPPVFAPGRGQTIFVCENPSVLAAAANELGGRCAPMLCVAGYLRQSAHRLLRLLSAAGWLPAYHGDFDWPGLKIAGLVIARHGASSWRMNAADYSMAPASRVRLGKVAPAAMWDVALVPVMLDRRLAVFEEQIIPYLLKDLAT